MENVLFVNTVIHAMGWKMWQICGQVVLLKFGGKTRGIRGYLFSSVAISDNNKDSHSGLRHCHHCHRPNHCN